MARHQERSLDVPSTSRESPRVDLRIRLSLDEVALLIEALDAYEYWELGDSLPRNNGAVFIPGDLRPEEDDRYWGTSPSPDDAEAE
jgi:hypothetical protein